MRTILHRLLLLLALLPLPVMAQTPPETALVDALGAGSFQAREKALTDLIATGNPEILPILRALEDGTLVKRREDGKVIIGTEGEKIGLNNRLRRLIQTGIATLTLRSPDRTVRLAAATSIFSSRNPADLPGLEEALAEEKDAAVLQAMRAAQAALHLTGEATSTQKLAAIRLMEARGGQSALNLLIPLTTNADPALSEAARTAVQRIESALAWWAAAQNITYGLSLGSVLLLAAIGLAVTFGVMGVINMAHGEMVMLGAYTTYVVQSLIRVSFPGLFDWSLLVAVPLAFLFTGAVGIAIERCIIRWLYGRPLETLLATWGLSLMLQQAVRSIFGPTNMEVGNPGFMAGAFRLGELSVTYGRLWIFIFCLLVFTALLLLLRRTRLGLQMRAVTQNRQMARAMGIRTARVDALTFGLGSGIAGLAGVALSQIDNVSPNLGQGYIIDSFMIVIFGGVGNLWGTLVGALSLGIVNKLLEPFAGAVLGKILVLVGIILFIQVRPRGLFALKGRAIEH